MSLLAFLRQKMIGIKFHGIGSPQLLVPMNQYGTHNDCTSFRYPNAICNESEFMKLPGL